MVRVIERRGIELQIMRLRAQVSAPHFHSMSFGFLEAFGFRAR